MILDARTNVEKLSAGVTNMYLVKQKHPIALRHNNTGVLEKHSWSMAFTLLDMPEYDPLHHLPTHRRDGDD